MRSPSLALLAALAAAAAPAGAQDEPKLGPRSFFPPDYDSEAWVDFDRLAETALWDELERAPLVKLGLKAFEREFGFDLLDVQQLRVGYIWSEVEVAPQYSNYAPRYTFVFQCGADVSLPPVGNGKRLRRTVQIGNYATVQVGDDPGDRQAPPIVFVVPQPRCFVYGCKSLIEPVLRSERAGGVPKAELLAATASRTPALAHLALSLRYDERFLQSVLPFPFTWYTAQDPPSFFVVRLDTADRDGTLRATLRMRFTDGSAGPAKFEAGAREALADVPKAPGLEKQPRLRGKLAQWLGQIAFARDGFDLVVSLDFDTDAAFLGDLLTPFVYSNF